MPISVVIPFYRHIAGLQHCLSSLSHYEQLPSEVIVVVQGEERENHKILKAVNSKKALSGNIRKILERLKLVNVTVPCQVTALNAGINQATGQMITVADENAVSYLQIKTEDLHLIRQ
ncbi:MAG: glycosyltransferase family A protein [Phormidesmis sp.]